MPFTFTAAHSSRISKPKSRKPPSFDRSTSSFASAARRKPVQRSQSKPEVHGEEDFFGDRLDDIGLVAILGSDLSLRDVVPTMKHIRSTMFDEMPTERSGMNSTRTSEVLNFRKALPPIVTNAHIHALVKSPTLVEKEISQLVRAGLVRRIIVPGRGSGASSISDGLVLVKDWTDMMRNARDMTLELKDKYFRHIESTDQDRPGLQEQLSEEETVTLMRAGLITASSSALRSSSNALSSSRNGVLGTLTSIDSISKAASGSVAAVGGQGAVLSSGGGGSAGLNTAPVKGVELNLSLPNTGAFLKLVESARSHLVHLLFKSKYNEAPIYLLRERWDGNITTTTPYGRSKDPFSIVLPGKTKKWKEFYGLNFDWVLAECLGGGMVEVFETGSVGLGARLV